MCALALALAQLAKGAAIVFFFFGAATLTVVCIVVDQSSPTVIWSMDRYNEHTDMLWKLCSFRSFCVANVVCFVHNRKWSTCVIYFVLYFQMETILDIVSV